jgi:hypothetical protein
MKLAHQALALAAWGMSRLGGCVALAALGVLGAAYVFSAAGETTVGNLIHAHIRHGSLLLPRALGILHHLRESAAWCMSCAVGATLMSGFGFALEARLRPRPNMPAGF